MNKPSLKPLFSITVIVAALGYFVDVYDLILVGIVRIPSLTSLGFSTDQAFHYGVMIINYQMIGMLIGGIIWGVLGDRIGRVKILFGSIILYSLANICNAFVQNIDQYLLCRFFAGLGLAGELGIAITLVLEILPTNIRGYGTMLVASIGVSGSIAANLVSKNFNWRYAYIIGGILGLALIFTQKFVLESGTFNKLEQGRNTMTGSQSKTSNFISFFTSFTRGNFFAFFTHKKLFFKYLFSILIGLPIWYSLSVLINFAPEFSKVLKITGKINGGDAIMFYYIGATAGDILSGMLSQILHSRKKVVILFISFLTVMIAVYLSQSELSVTSFYIICALTGLPAGYWAVFVTMAAEQFGTNLRATAASTIPNFVRGLVYPTTSLFYYLIPSNGVITSGAFCGLICLSLAFISIFMLDETYSKELDYSEN
ncbi:MAG: MFS transporter [Candidatus Kapabacteria bacterium]|nr:MFS transporter [Candidatus Kapabacteria bacterium]